MASSNSSSRMRPHNVGSQSPFQDLDKLRDSNGLIAIISQRKSNGTMTIAIFKEFERDGKTERTSFIPEALFGSYQDLLKLAIERVDQLKTSELEQLAAGDR